MSASVQDLAERIGGRLRLAELPPLGGPWEPVTRIVVRCDDVRPGDLYWPLDTRGVKRAEEAYLRGALGVVAAGRSIEPFPGKYTIAVADARWALWLWARDCRRRCPGLLAAVAGGDAGDAAVAGELAAAIVARAGGETARAATGEDALASLANRRNNDVALLLDLSGLDAEATKQLCEAGDPDVLLTLSPAELPPRRAGENKVRTRTVVTAVGTEWDYGAGRAEQERRLTVGRDPRCTWCASQVEHRGGELTLEVDGQIMRLAAWGRHWVEPVLGAYAVGRLLNLPPETIAASLAEWRPEAPRVAVTNVRGIWLVHGSAGRDLATLDKAVAVLRELPCSGERIAVCNATEQESGKSLYSSEFWAAMAETLVARLGIDRLLACGADGDKLAAAAVEAGLPAEAIAVTEDVASLCEATRERAGGGDALLAWNLDARTIGPALTNHEHLGRKAA